MMAKENVSKRKLIGLSKISCRPSIAPLTKYFPLEDDAVFG